jgi:hypothetical protein
MKKFKEFLENYDFYIDKPYGWEGNTASPETDLQEKVENWTKQKMHSDLTDKDYRVKDVYDYAKKHSKPVKLKISDTDALEWWDKQYDMDNAKHKKRMMDADTDYPVLAIKVKNGKYSIADGLNRIKKLHDVEHEKNVYAYVIDQKDLKNIDEV